MSRYRRMAAIVVIGALAVAGALMMMGTALAQQDPYGNGSPPVVSPNVITRPDSQPGASLLRRNPSVQGANVSESSLPFTGADLTLFVATGLGAIATGTVILHRSRAARARLRSNARGAE
jgi:hypothetical protein